MAQPQARRTEPSDPQLLALKVPPHSVEAEQSLLGGLLLDNQAFDRIADLVTGEDFYRDDHRRIFRHLSKLIEHAKPAGRGHGRRVDRGEARTRTVPAPRLSRFARAEHAQRAQHPALRRAGPRALDPAPPGPGRTEIAESALAPSGKEVGQMLTRRRRGSSRSRARPARHAGFESIQPVLARVFERIDHLYRQENKSDVTGLPTGFADLDEKTAGLQQATW